MSRPIRICVVGAGVIGMSTALALQTSSSLKSAEVMVTVMAAQFSPNLVSDVAAGLWLPHALGNTPQELISRWGDATYDHFQRLFMSEVGSETGVTQHSGYLLFNSTGNDLAPPWKDTVGSFHLLTESERRQFEGVQEGMSFSSFTCEPTIYLKLLHKLFKRNNGRIVERKLSSLDEICGDYDIIVNCSGLGSYSLVQDKQLDPIRGQVIQVRAPWIKCFYIFESADAHILPGVSKVTVGGVHRQSDWNDKPTDQEASHIWSKCCKLFPSLKGAEVIRTVAGLRPGRSTTVRLERGQNIVSKGRKVPVIHNYGHGGSGVTLHYGCAIDTVNLVVQAIGETLKQKL